jgi:hypothetical protein
VNKDEVVLRDIRHFFCHYDHTASVMGIKNNYEALAVLTYEKKNLSQRTFSNKSPTWTGLGLTPGHCGEMPDPRYGP